MIGHGRPSSFRRCGDSRAQSARAWACAAIAIFVGALWAVPITAQESTAPDPTRLRITWGGGEPSRWFGRIWLDDGSLSNLKLLGVAADGAGSVWLQEGALRVATLSAHKLDCVDITADGRPDAQLFVQLSPTDKQSPQPIKVPLSQLISQSSVVRLDDRGSTLKIERIPDHPLRIRTNSAPTIFAPGEQFSFELQPVLPDAVAGTTLDIVTTLSPARGGEAIWSDEQRLAVPVEGTAAVTLNVPLPKAEGVYTVHIAASRPSGFRQRFFPGAATPLAERSIDVVVFDERRKQALPPSQWETVLEIDPTNARWWERQVRRFPRLSRGPLGSIRASAVDLPLGRFVELPATGRGAEPQWQAYSLPLDAAGLPHVLEIEYPADQQQHFGVSIVEPDAADAVEDFGRDGGVYVEGLGRTEAAGIQTHRSVFWPRTQSPLLVVTNQHPTAAAHFGRIRLLKPDRGQLPASRPATPTGDRIVAAYFARPLIADTFGASKGTHPNSAVHAEARIAVDDWQTHYEAATRLTEYLHYGGYNAAIVSVLADGSAIYPSSHVPSTRLHNASRAAPETMNHDPLELMLKVFDRERLALIPALQLAAPLPALEALRRDHDPQKSGLEWIGPNGETWLATYGTNSGLAPYYNLLEPRVQMEIMQVVRELLERYAHHSSLNGLAIQLSANGFAQLPPLDWGLDDATIARFERDTGIRIPGDGPNRFAARHALLTDEHAEAWRKWRAEQVAKFYAQVAALMRDSGHEKRRLVLTLEDSFAHPLLASRIRPNILLPNRIESMLLDLGIHPAWLEKAPGVVVCRTRYVEPTTPLPERAVDLEANEAFANLARSDALARPSAALLYHRPQRQRITSFAAKSPFKINGDSEFVFQPLAHGYAVRRPYVLTLIQSDPAVLFDGGELLPIGQEDELRPVRNILRQLPTSAEITETASQPVIVRMYAESDGVTMLVVNASPWHADAEVTLDLPQAAKLEPLGTTENDAAGTARRALAAGQQPWSLSLAPYDVQAVRISVPAVKVVNVQSDSSEAAETELAARLADLANRDLTAPRHYQALSNPSFEPRGAANPPSGWRLVGNAATVELDAHKPKHGTTSIYIRNDGNSAVLESETFAMPETGQLAMTVHVREQKMTSGAELRMVFEAIHSGQVYRRSAIVAASTPDPLAAGEWQYKAILVNDLPLESNGQMRVRFELSGPGEVWLDNVTLYDLLFPLKFYKYEGAEIVQFLQRTHAAKTALETGRVADCAQLLDDYWLKFLEAYTPTVVPIVANQPPPVTQQPLPPPADENQQPAPGFSERIKRVIPFLK